jgi:hypothetical protein
MRQRTELILPLQFELVIFLHADLLRKPMHSKVVLKTLGYHRITLPSFEDATILEALDKVTF